MEERLRNYFSSDNHSLFFYKLTEMEERLRNYFSSDKSITRRNSFWKTSIDKLEVPDGIFNIDMLNITILIILLHEHKETFDEVETGYHYDFDHKSKCSITFDRYNDIAHVELIIDPDDFRNNEIRKMARDLEKLFLAKQTRKYYKSSYILKKIDSDGKIEEVNLFDALTVQKVEALLRRLD